MKSQASQVNSVYYKPFESLLIASSVAHLLMDSASSEQKSKSPISQLDDSALLHIFSFLSASELCKVSQINSLCLKVSSSSSLWKDLYLRELVASKPGIPKKIVLKELFRRTQDVSDWKLAFQECFFPSSLLLAKEPPSLDDMEPKVFSPSGSSSGSSSASDSDEDRPRVTRSSKRGVKRSAPQSAAEPKRKRRRSSPNRATTWLSIVSAAIKALARDSTATYGELRLYFTNKEICNYISEHWDELCKGKKRTTTWWHTVSRELTTNPGVFKSGYHVYQEYGYWSLQEMDESNPTSFAEVVSVMQSVSS